MTDEWLEAREVREILDRFEEQDWNRHTEDAFESIESYMEEVVEEGRYITDSKVEMGLDLTLRERVSGRRQQDATAMLVIGLMLGSALERDVPMDSGREDQWRDGEFVLPDEVPESELLEEIREGDRASVNGGYYVGSDRQDEAEALVDEGKVVRLQNPAGVSPVYVPMDSDHYSDDRLQRMKEKQSTDGEEDES